MDNIKKDRILVFGYSKVAQEIVKYLENNNYNFVMASSSQEGIEEGKKHHHQVFYIDYNKDEELRRFGIGGEVTTLFCFSNNFNKNLFVTLSARNIDKNLKIISLVTNQQEENKMLLAGATKTIDPYAIGANQFFTMMKKERVFEVIQKILYEESKISFEEIVITKDFKFLNKQLNSINIEGKYNIIVLALYDSKRNRLIYNIQKILRKIKEKDILIVMGDREEILKFKKDML